MARITSGPIAGATSGTLGNVTFVRGSGGGSIRVRSARVRNVSSAVFGVQARFTHLKRAWAGVAAAERASWATWAVTHPIEDRLGAARVVSASTAFTKLNARILQAGGTQINVPPTVAAPGAVAGQAISASIAGSFVSVFWTSGAVGVDKCLAVWLYVGDSRGVTFYRHNMKLVAVSSANQASPYNVNTLARGRYGTLIVGQIVKCELEVWGKKTGLVSARVFCEATVGA